MAAVFRESEPGDARLLRVVAGEAESFDHGPPGIPALDYEHIEQGVGDSARDIDSVSRGRPGDPVPGAHQRNSDLLLCGEVDEMEGVRVITGVRDGERRAVRADRPAERHVARPDMPSRRADPPAVKE